jgi:deoxyhypusine synthase
MAKEYTDSKPVKDIILEANEGADSIVRQMFESGGFVAKKLAVGVNILEKMNRDEGCVKFFSSPSAPVATGCRGIYRDLIKNQLVDVFITTSGMVDHDYARVWRDYYHGDFEMDDSELYKKGINREGNVLIPNECYGEILEDRIQPLLEKLYAEKPEYSTKELCWALGESLKDEDNKESSILYWAWKKQIPIYIPGPTDGAFGSQMWLFSQKKPDFKIDLFKDGHELNSIVMDAKTTGAFMIGGGISKHHTIWWNQFRGGLDYAVYITTAPEWDGSLSGARIKEAISWGKVKEKADHIDIEGDATTMLPLMISSLMERLGTSQK